MSMSENARQSAPHRGLINPRLREIRHLLTPFLTLPDSSFTFFVNDPSWPEQPLRMVSMHNLQYPEPLYGIVHPETTRLHSDPRHQVEWFPLATDTPAPRSRRAARWAALIAQKPIFGDFITREGVTSFARLAWFSDTLLRALLFLNYRTAHPTDPSFAELLRQLHRSIDARGLCDASAYTTSPPSLNYLQPIMQLTANNGIGLADATSHASDGHHEPFAEVLLRLIQFTRHTPTSARATLYLVDTDADYSSLRLALAVGAASELAPPTISLATGASIAAWVAIRQRSLLIKDIMRSRYRTLCSEADSAPPPFRCVLAAPVYSACDFLGVVMLELQRALPPAPLPSYLAHPSQLVHCLRMMHYAGRQVALAIRMAHQNRTIRYQEELITLATEGTGEASTLRRADRLARWACERIPADACDIWTCEDVTPSLVASHRDYSEARVCFARDTGWTKWVALHQIPIALSTTEADIGHWTAGRWEASTGRWHPVQLATSECPSMHPQAMQGPYHTHLGWPLLNNGVLVAVVWFKFRGGEGLDASLMNHICSVCTLLGSVVRICQHKTATESAVREQLALLLRVLKHEAMSAVNDRVLRLLTAVETRLDLLHYRDELRELVEYQAWIMAYYLEATQDSKPKLSFSVLLADRLAVDAANAACRIANSLKSQPQAEVRSLVAATVTVRADNAALVVSLVNLISNAKKYGVRAEAFQEIGEYIQPPIVVSVEESQRHDRRGVVFRVEDAGPGIPEAIRKHIGRKVLTNNTDCGSRRGAGLGTFIAGTLAANMHGELWASAERSDRGGARVCIWLPIGERQ